MARTDRRTKNTPPKRGASNLNKWAIGAFVIGVIGLVAIDELAGKLFFLLVAAVGGFLFARPYIMKGKSKPSDPQPLQQFSPAPPASVQSSSTQGRAQAQEAPNYYNQAPMLPNEVDGIPLAYQYQDNGIAMADQVVKDFASIKPGYAITFVPEPTNQYDPKAIQMHWKHGMLGYVYRGQMQDMIHDFMQQGLPIVAVVHSVDPMAKRITYSIAFYRNKRSMFRGAPVATGKLTSSAGQEAQDNISLCEEGEELTVLYDYEKERYEVEASTGFIGCLPKKLEQYGEAATYIIDELGETDAGKGYVIVGVYELK